MNELPEPTCGDCQAFYTARDQHGFIKGLCRSRAELNDLDEDSPFCPRFTVLEKRKGMVQSLDRALAERAFMEESAPKPEAAQNVRRRIVQPRTVQPRTAGAITPGPKSEGRDIATLDDPVIGDTDGEYTMDRDGLKQVLRELLEEETMYGFPEMGGRWEDGTIVLKPASPDLQPKEIPIDAFFHKVVMVRDRLRVLESKINGQDKLSEQEKVELQTYISKCYGSLTSFNVLFKSKSDHFKSK